MSLAAMEAELQSAGHGDPRHDRRHLQEAAQAAGPAGREARLACAGTLSPGQERRYKELKDELITAVKSLSLNQNRIDSLVEQLYDINKRLMQNEGRLLRLAESYGVSARQTSWSSIRVQNLIRTG